MDYTNHVLLYLIYRFHHVSSVERNLAVNIWWSASATPKLSDCHLPNTTLDKFTFVGFGTLFPREIIDGMKSAMKTMFEVYEETKVDLEHFRLYLAKKSDFFEEGAVWSDEMMGKVDKIFTYLDEPSHDAVLAPEDITSLSAETWDKIAVLVKELSALVDDQFEQDGEDDFEPGDELEKHSRIKDEL
ncbi:Hypothetical predicted protein [Paramuricea clavata]|uniref:Uncharacterized protein n=1 Tax=Paramuricea clavata TaxID=317549 RepID=A0A7D9DPF3_PARCT|nr:Hypothetical predicted protein [Paramuricea clavata]